MDEFSELEDFEEKDVTQPDPKKELVLPWAVRMPDEEYFRLVMFSQSCAKTILSESCYHLYRSHAGLGGNPNQSPDKWTSAERQLVQGSAVHALLLGYDETVVEVPFDSYRTNASKAYRDRIIEAGKIPGLTNQFLAWRERALRIRSEAQKMGVPILGAFPEQVLLWEFDGVDCCSKLDMIALSDGDVVVIDLKCTDRSCDPSTVERKIQQELLDVQAFAYREAVYSKVPHARVRVIFLFAEMKPPYLMLPVELSESYYQLGEAKWRRALHKWKRCLATNEWPGYTEKVLKVSPSEWQIKAELRNPESEEIVTRSIDVFDRDLKGRFQ